MTRIETGNSEKSGLIVPLLLGLEAILAFWVEMRRSRKA